MQPYNNSVAKKTGAALSGVSVRVTNATTGALATIYSDNGVTTQTNPMTTDTNGNYGFYAADGRYVLTFSGSTFTTFTIPVLLEDPADGSSALAASTGSTLIGWIRTATGAVASTLAKWLGWQPISLFEFMTEAQRNDVSAGTGAVDVTAAVQAAVTHVQTLPFGGTIFAPAGKYRLTSTVTFNLSKYIRVYGEGKATRFFGATGFGHLFTVTTSSSSAHGSIFEDFMMVGAASGTTSGISLTDANTFQLNRIWVENQTVGVTQATSFAIEYNGCVFDVCYSEGIKATSAAHNTLIRGCNFYTCGVTGSKPAINFTVASNNIVMDDNDAENCYRFASLQDCTSISIDNNYIELSDVSDIAFLGTCKGVTMNKNWIGLGAANFVIENVDGMEFKHNTVFDQTVTVGSGVSQLDAAKNHTLGTGAVSINYMAEYSVASGSTPYFAPDGPDTNIQGRYSSKGTGDVALYTGTASILSMLAGYVAGAVNWLRIAPSTTGLAVTLTAQGSDTDIGIRIFPKGIGDLRLANGNMRVEGTGNGIAIKAGANSKLDTVTLVAGSATVNNTSVTAASYIRFSLKTAGGTIAAPPYASTITAGVSFVVTAGASDTSTYIYEIVEPL